MKVIEGRLGRSASQLEEAYDLFRLEKQGALLSPATLEFYDLHVRAFFRWLAVEAPDVRHFDQLDANLLRRYKAEQASRVCRYGRRLQPESLHASHRALRVFLRWAEAEGYSFDLRILRLPAPRLPRKEMTVYHIAQVRHILAACHSPSEDLVVRILVGAGLRMGELCELSLRGPDGLSDLMIDSLDRGHAEVRVRSDAAKGHRARRVPITPKLAAAIKRYSARHHVDIDYPQLLVHSRGKPYETGGINSMMQRLEDRVGFRVHAHAFRHTFATAATRFGWNLERLRAAMGHADYSVLQRYVWLSMQRDLGRREDWRDLIVTDALP